MNKIYLLYNAPVGVDLLQIKENLQQWLSAKSQVWLN